MKLKSLTLILAVALGAQVAFAQQSVTDPSVEFAPHWYGQIQGGAGYTIGETAFKDLISPAGALSFGYQFNPALGLRFGASGYQGKGNVVYPFELYKFNYAQGNVDLTLDLANLIRYNHKRVFNPYIFAGLGVAYGFNNGATKVASSGAKFDLLWEKNMISPVGRLGIGSAIRLSDAVALTLYWWNSICDEEGLLLKGHSTYGTIAWSPSEKIELQLKGGYEYASDPLPGQDPGGFRTGGALHWRPVEDMRVHAAVGYDAAAGAVSGLVGIMYNFRIHIGRK